MAFVQEKRAALHILEGIENATIQTSEAAALLDESDPALVYLIITYLRQRYSGHPAADGVFGRLVEITNARSSINGKMRAGKADPISQWFEEEREYRELSASEFIDIVVEKLEG